MGGGNLIRSDFDRSENCYLVGGMNVWWGEGQKFGGGGIFPGVGGITKFFASGGDSPHPPPVGKTLMGGISFDGGGGFKKIMG